MEQGTGFANVDASGRQDDLVGYLALLAQRLTVFRQQGYQRLKLQPGAAVLDVGCGAGEVCVELAQLVGRDGRVAGVDFSETMMAEARRKATASGGPIELEVASVYRLPFSDESFDAVRAERVFQHLEDPEAGLREMMRVTRHAGRVMLLDPDHGQCGLSLDDPGHRRVFESARRALLRMIANPHSGTRLRAMMLRAGLLQVEQITQVLEIAYEDYPRAFFLTEQLASAAAAGDITQAQGQEYVRALQQRQREGTFFCNALAYSVVGVRP